jgi:hypothetical protein
LLPLLLAPLVAVLALASCGSEAEAELPPVTITVQPEDSSAPMDDVGAGADGSPQGMSPDYQEEQPYGDVGVVSAGDTAGAPASYDDAVQRFAAASRSSQVEGHFMTPDGGLFCTLVRDGAAMACEFQKDFAPAPAGYCDPSAEQLVRRVEIDEKRVFGVCTDQRVANEWSAPWLKPGEKTTVEGTPLECLSEDAGVTCVDTASRRGFFVGHASFSTF